jgi:hypothetical protein
MAMVRPNLVLVCVRMRYLLLGCKVSGCREAIYNSPLSRNSGHERGEIPSEALTDLKLVSGYVGCVLEGVSC